MQKRSVFARICVNFHKPVQNKGVFAQICVTLLRGQKPAHKNTAGAQSPAVNTYIKNSYFTIPYCAQILANSTDSANPSKTASRDTPESSCATQASKPDWSGSRSMKVR